VGLEGRPPRLGPRPRTRVKAPSGFTAHPEALAHALPHPQGLAEAFAVGSDLDHDLGHAAEASTSTGTTPRRGWALPVAGGGQDHRAGVSEIPENGATTKVRAVAVEGVGERGALRCLSHHDIGEYLTLDTRL
jgi:hypothetical protein